MTFLNEAKTLLSLFIEETRESVSWFKAELLRQYHLAILKEIKETYPTTYPYIDTVYEIVDGLAQDEDCPDFVEAPERTNIESDFDLNDPAFETEDEAYALKEIEEGLPESFCPSAISDDGLNKPRYPYDKAV